MKPNYGLVSRRGAFPLVYSLDHCGPIVWTVSDATTALSVIAGFEPLDRASVDVPIVDFTRHLGQDLLGLRVGYARALFVGINGVSSEIVSTVDNAAGCWRNWVPRWTR